MNDPKDPENHCKDCKDETYREDMLFEAIEDDVYAFINDRIEQGANPSMLAAALMRVCAHLAFDFVELTPEGFADGAKEAFQAIREGHADA